MSAPFASGTTKGGIPAPMDVSMATSCSNSDLLQGEDLRLPWRGRS